MQLIPPFVCTYNVNNSQHDIICCCEFLACTQTVYMNGWETGHMVMCHAAKESQCIWAQITE